MNILDLVVGKPIKTSDERAEQIGPAQGIPIFGLDALSSAAYGPEAALSLLIPLGLLGIRYIIPISAAIIALLVIVYFSCRQTITAYPLRRRLLYRSASTLVHQQACWPRLPSSPIISSRPPWAFPRESVPWSRLFRPFCRTRFLSALAF